jgi:hypothetical protein
MLMKLMTLSQTMVTESNLVQGLRQHALGQILALNFLGLHHRCFEKSKRCGIQRAKQQVMEVSLY